MALLEFFGEGCPHCVKMAPLVDKLKEEGFEVEQFETWHNEENAEKFKKHDDGNCGGVPYFMNTESKEWICGATDYDTLKKWAEGGKM